MDIGTTNKNSGNHRIMAARAAVMINSPCASLATSRAPQGGLPTGSLASPIGFVRFAADIRCCCKTAIFDLFGFLGRTHGNDLETRSRTVEVQRVDTELGWTQQAGEMQNGRQK